jgi:hypothetical protein
MSSPIHYYQGVDALGWITFSQNVQLHIEVLNFWVGNKLPNENIEEAQQQL